MAEITQILTNDLSPKRGRRQAASPARVRSFITHRKTIDLSLSSDGQFGQVCKTPSLSPKRNFIRNILKLNRLCGSSKSYTPLNECFPPFRGPRTRNRPFWCTNPLFCVYRTRKPPFWCTNRLFSYLCSLWQRGNSYRSGVRGPTTCRT